MTQYPPQDNTSGGNNYGYSQGASQDYYQGQTPSYNQQPPQYGSQPPQYGQYPSPGQQEHSHSPQPGYQHSPQPSYQQPSYGSDQGRDHAQSYHGTNDQAYQQYPHDRPAQQYGSSDYSHQGPAGGSYSAPQHQQQQQQYGGSYDTQQQYPPQPPYGSLTGPSYDQNYRQEPNQPSHNYSNSQYGTSQYGNPPPGPYGAAPQPGAEDRGLMGALAGGAAGGFAGHKMNHGIIGTIGGAVAGSMLEDKYKDKKKKDKKHKKEKHHKRRDSSSSSSSSSSSDSGRSPSLAGNYSASSRGARLEDDGRTLVAECRDVNGYHCKSRIDLNACLTNTNGSLRWARGGNFRPSARDVRLVDGGRVLEAELGDGRGGWVRNHIRLDERIENSNGRLAMI